MTPAFAPAVPNPGHVDRRQVMQWLDLTVPESELLLTPPAHSFIVEKIVILPAQASLL